MAVTVYVNDSDVIAERVRKIIRTRETVDLTEFVTSALMLVTGVFQPAEYTQAEMEVLHVYLSAHLYEVDYQRKFEQEIGKTREKPETIVAVGLNLTRPGQQVRILDYKKAFPPDDVQLRKARMFWAGTPRSAF